LGGEKSIFFVLLGPRIIGEIDADFQQRARTDPLSTIGRVSWRTLVRRGSGPAKSDELSGSRATKERTRGPRRSIAKGGPKAPQPAEACDLLVAPDCSRLVPMPLAGPAEAALAGRLIRCLSGILGNMDCSPRPRVRPSALRPMNSRGRSPKKGAAEGRRGRRDGIGHHRRLRARLRENAARTPLKRARAGGRLSEKFMQISIGFCAGSGCSVCRTLRMGLACA